MNKADFVSLILSSLLIALSVLGTQLMNVDLDNRLLILLIVSIVGVVCVGTIFDNLFQHSYPVIVFAIAISLIFSRTLLTNYLVGWDNHAEYYSYRLTMVEKHWPPTNPPGYYSFASVLSSTILPVMLSEVSGLEGVLLHKFVFPILYSFAVVELFLIYRLWFRPEIAFLGAFFFMSNTAFLGGIQSTRQVTGEVALFSIILLFFIIMKKRIFTHSSIIAIVLFVFGLTILHYTCTYLALAYLALSLLVTLALGKHWKRDKMFSLIRFTALITLTFSVIWYIYVAGEYGNWVFSKMTSVIRDTVVSSVTEFWNPYSRDVYALQAIGLASVKSIGRELARILVILTTLLTAVGFMLAFKKFRRQLEWYERFSTVGIILLLSALLLPSLSTQLGGAHRFYHYALIFLAPYCPQGIRALFNISGKIFHKRNILKTLILMSSLLILCLHFLFQTGFIFELYGDIPSSFSLSMYRMDGPFFSQGEVAGVEWMEPHKVGYSVYSDDFGVLLPSGYFDGDAGYFIYNTSDLNGYFYFRHYNLKNNLVYIRYGAEVDIWNHINITDVPICKEVLERGEKVYDNGYCIIYYMVSE